MNRLNGMSASQERRLLDFTARLTVLVAAISSVGPGATVIEVRHRTNYILLLLCGEVHMRSHSTLLQYSVTLHAHDACALPRGVNVDDVVRLQPQICKLTRLDHIPHFTTHRSLTSTHQSQLHTIHLTQTVQQNVVDGLMVSSEQARSNTTTTLPHRRRLGPLLPQLRTCDWR